MPLNFSASGFTTRSDIGPARDFMQQDPMALREEEDEEKYNENEEGLFAGTPYERDDEEADRIYEAIDAKMDERRRKRREEKEKEMMLKQKDKPKLSMQFDDVKRDLAQLSDSDWANIPEPGNHRSKRLKKTNEKERFTPLPDSVIIAGMQNTEYGSREQVAGISTSLSGMSTAITDLTSVSIAKEKVLSINLDKYASEGSKTCVDPKGYLTGLSSMLVRSDAEIGDIKKGRLLLESLIKTNPKHAPGWISLARLEEIDGKLAKAKSIIAQGCLECPKSDDVWLEAARLNKGDVAKQILAHGALQNPESVKLWMAAVDLENDFGKKRKILRKALENIPNSVRLWKSAIELEEDENAKLMLSKAVECVPSSVELWLALARLETHQVARSVLNKARQACPTSFEIWIAAANLEDANGNTAMVSTIIDRGLKVLESKGANLTREKWMEQAAICEKSGNIATCHAIIKSTISIDIDEDDRKSTWLSDAESFQRQGLLECSRAVYSYTLSVFPSKKSIWLAAVKFEKSFGTREKVDELLQRAVKACPHSELLWLMWAKEKWISWNDIEAARNVLRLAFIESPDNDQLWLAAAKLEAENGFYDNAKAILCEAREKTESEKIWMKSAMLEWHCGNFDGALEIINEALNSFASFDKLWMMKGQILQIKGQLEEARESYQKALKACPKSTPLWILAAQLEMNEKKAIRARSILDKARVLIPKNENLWYQSVVCELKSANTSVAKSILSKALQECPQSGKLWALSVFLEPKLARKGKVSDALKKCDNDPYVFIATARIFWYEKSLDKAKGWFEKALQADSDCGDSWGWYFLFLSSEYPGEVDEFIKRFEAADVKHGILFPTVSKDVANLKKSKREILEITSKKLEAEASFCKLKE